MFPRIADEALLVARICIARTARDGDAHAVASRNCDADAIAPGSHGDSRTVGARSVDGQGRGCARLQDEAASRTNVPQGESRIGRGPDPVLVEVVMGRNGQFDASEGNGWRGTRRVDNRLHQRRLPSV